MGLSVILFSDRELQDSELVQKGMNDSDSFAIVDPRLDTKFDIGVPAKYNRDSDSDSDGVIKHLSFLYNASLATSLPGEINQMLETILDLVFNWLEADRAVILMQDGRSDSYSQKAVRHRGLLNDDEGEKTQTIVNINRAITEYVSQTGSPIQASSFESANDQVELLGTGVAEAICVPIQGRNQVLGMIYVDRLQKSGSETVNLKRQESGSCEPVLNCQGVQFNKEHLRLLIVIAHQAASSIENTKFYNTIVRGERLTAVGQTLNVLSHHIKNILQSINGGKHVIEDGFKRDSIELISRGWDIVDRNQARISNLVMDMMSYSKPGEPMLQLRDLRVELEECLCVFRPRFPKVEIVCKPLEEFPNLRIDGRSIQRAISNILETLIDLHPDPENAEITIRLRNDSGGTVSVLFLMSDLDVSRERAQSLFDPLSISSEDAARGIRLAVSRKIAREHGGELTFRTNRRNEQRFKLVLPVDPASAVVPTTQNPVSDPS